MALTMITFSFIRRSVLLAFFFVALFLRGEFGLKQLIASCLVLILENDTLLMKAKLCGNIIKGN